jgi:hypothetical protein
VVYRPHFYTGIYDVDEIPEKPEFLFSFGVVIHVREILRVENKTRCHNYKYSVLM